MTSAGAVEPDDDVFASSAAGRERDPDERDDGE